MIFEFLKGPIRRELSRFCKRVYILLDEVHNYETQLIGERHRNKLKSDWKNDTLTFLRLRVI